MFIGIGGRIIELSNLPGASRPGGTVIIPLSISYDQTAYCYGASNPTPTVAGNEGAGTYSSTTGIVFADSGTNTGSSTGIINISSSTPGATYVITYTDTNAATATFDFTLNALDNASFSYSAGSYDPADPDPTPTISGLAGGTFSSTTGLVFVDSGTNTGSSTGQIDLSATTIASYTITYDTTSSGSSVCPNTSTQTVEVAFTPIANNYSMSFDGSDDYIISEPIDVTNNTTLSIWFKTSNINTNQGLFEMMPDPNTSDYLIVWVYNGKIEVDAANSGSSAKASSVLSSNTWYNLVITKTTGVIDNIYINGVNDTQTGAGLGFVGGRNNLYIGATYQGTAYANEFIGNIDEVAIWNTALTSTQVSEIYSATGTNLTKDLTTVSGSNLVYWNRMGD